MKIAAFFILIVGLFGCASKPSKDQTDLGQVLKQRQALSACFRRNQLRQDDVIYSKAAELTVTPEGKTKNVKVSQSNRRTDECLSRRLAALEFTPREKEKVLRFMMNYEVQSGRANLTLRSIE